MRTFTYDELRQMCIATMVGIFSDDDIEQRERQAMADGALAFLILAQCEATNSAPTSEQARTLKAGVVRDLKRMAAEQELLG